MFSCVRPEAGGAVGASDVVLDELFLHEFLGPPHYCGCCAEGHGCSATDDAADPRLRRGAAAGAPSSGARPLRREGWRRAVERVVGDSSQPRCLMMKWVRPANPLKR